MLFLHSSQDAPLRWIAICVLLFSTLSVVAVIALVAIG